MSPALSGDSAVAAWRLPIVITPINYFPKPYFVMRVVTNDDIQYQVNTKAKTGTP
jgi:hypothetical protein